jgi:hypothetical protein
VKVVLRKNALYFECPAQNCGNVRVPLDGEPHWNWNGSLDKPTITPSVKIQWDFGEEPNRTHNICHFNVIDGVLHFCADCTHELKGQKIPMPDVAPDFEKFLAD